MRKIHKCKPLLFEPDEWFVIEREFNEDSNLRNETIFSLGNGYLGIRGMFEEGFYGSSRNSSVGTFINGVYEFNDYKYLWKRPGFPDRTHSILNVANAALVSLRIDGEKFCMATGTVENYCRVLDLRQGILSRSLIWTASSGKKLKLDVERFISLDDLHLLAVKYSITPLNFSSCVEIISEIDGNVINETEKKPEIGSLNVGALHIADKGTCRDIGFVTQGTRVSGFLVSTAMVNSLSLPGEAYNMEVIPHDTKNIHRFTFTIEEGNTYTLEKYVNYYSSLETSASSCLQNAIDGVERCCRKGYAALCKAHVDKWNAFWEAADIVIKGDTSLQQAVRFSMFHIMQSAGKDGYTNISANGLTGEGYQGHTFWDTEVFILPFFIYTAPEIAKQLLMYRYNILPKAKERASQMEDQGALYSWNSINGEECGFVFEAATAQYHINADICHAIHKYWEVTGDERFLIDYGAEILFETSKCMAHRGSFIKTRNDRFCINVVCGPDEYTPVVDNNCYTNVMTKFQLDFSYKTARMMQEKYPGLYKALAERINLTEEEICLWKKAADNMYIPYNNELGLLMQDDQFVYRDPIDLDAIPLERLPLLTHLHPLNLWRFQVAKQADIVLLMYLRGQEFTGAVKKAVYDFYEPRTIHDSSLSAGIHCIEACEVGYMQNALDYFRQTARMDLDDYNRNTHLGIHAACMGVTWQAVTSGFAGMRVYDGILCFKPCIPVNWECYSFKLNFKGRIIKVSVEKEQIVYELLYGDCIDIVHYGKDFCIHVGKPIKMCITAIRKTECKKEENCAWIIK